MFKSEQARKDIKVLSRKKEGRLAGILVAAMYVFSKEGRDEVSLSEFQECISELQKRFSLGYKFSERFLCSLDLLTDLKELSRERYVRQYIYRHDAWLPKRFVRLMPLGKVYSKKIIGTFPPEMAEALNDAVKLSIRNYKSRWHSLAR